MLAKVIQSPPLDAGQFHWYEYLFEVEEAAVASKLQSWWDTAKVAIAVNVLEIVTEITLDLGHVS